jgi:16S rRNA (cytosine1402-N4)-methyltransferase
VNDPYHIPVLLNDCINGLNINPDGIYVDVTFGGGGHSMAILDKLGKHGRLLALDQDPEAFQNAPIDERFELIAGNFEFVKNFLRERGIKKVDGVLADLGVSSHQFNTAERGFSIRYDAPLDMRMSMEGSLTAKKIAKNYSEDELKWMLRNFGELKNASAVARRIVQKREEANILTVFDLKEAVSKSAPRGKENQFYARVFQAFRIEVNRELKVLEHFLQRIADIIKPGGRLVVMSYHSLEDRLVKNYLRAGNNKGIIEKDFYGNMIRPFKPLAAKAVKPGEDEIKENNRARSARLRIAEKT